ncbi:MAG: hypothetical protein LRS46_00730 [Desulfurococcales archaeon]|nr:hypothetical protein [Desulfurococcales archaeon]
MRSKALNRFEERLRSIREKLISIDVQTLGDHVGMLVLETLKKIKAKDRESLSSSLRMMSSTIREYVPFSFSALLIGDILDITASKLDQNSLDPSEALESAEAALKRLLTYSTSSLKKLAINLARHIDTESKVLVLGYTNALFKILSLTSSKIETIYTLSFWPLMSGRGFAVELRSRGLNAIPWPDSAVSQAVSESDYVIISTVGVSAEGVFIAESGSYGATLLASNEGKDVIVLTRAWNFRSSTPDNIGEITSEIPHPLKKNILMKIKVFDIIPLAKARTIVTDLNVLPIDNIDSHTINDYYTKILDNILLI